jgi:hypothetical protein
VLLLILASIAPTLSFLWFLIFATKRSELDIAFDTIIQDVEDHVEEDEYVSIAIIDDTAYWVVDNTFYQAEVVNGHVDGDTSRPIDAFELSRSDLDKMMYILDNLKEG